MACALVSVLGTNVISLASFVVRLPLMWVNTHDYGYG